MDGGDYKPDDAHAVSFPGSSWSAQHSSQQPRMSDSNAPQKKKKNRGGTRKTRCLVGGVPRGS